MTENAELLNKINDEPMTTSPIPTSLNNEYVPLQKLHSGGLLPASSTKSTVKIAFFKRVPSKNSTLRNFILHQVSYGKNFLFTLTALLLLMS